MQTVGIKTEYIKLDQLLKFAGIAQTGGHAKELILSGKILYNGELCLQRGKKVRPGDEISIDGQIIRIEAE